jgi:phage tail-like protein
MTAVRDRKKDPYVSFRFRVEFDGKEVAQFSEVTGLQMEIETEEYREGGLNDFIHQFAGKVRYPSKLVLKHGLMDSTTLWKWGQEVAKGDPKRKNVSIILQDDAGDARHRWNFDKAFPVKWSGPDLKAGTAEVAIETLELAHCGISRG